MSQLANQFKLDLTKGRSLLKKLLGASFLFFFLKGIIWLAVFGTVIISGMS